VWREKGNKRFTLVITDTGLEAIGVAPEEIEPAEKPEAKPAEWLKAAAPKKPKPVKAKPGKSAIRKPDIILNLMQRAKGATIEQLQEATGWQPHSVRAVMSGWRK